MPMSGIILNAVVKEFVSREGTRVRALGSVSFETLDGRITCIVGPTGSGKSTVLRIVSGLDRADAGTVLVEGQTPAGLKGRIGFMDIPALIETCLELGGNRFAASLDDVIAVNAEALEFCRSQLMARAG